MLGHTLTDLLDRRNVQRIIGGFPSHLCWLHKISVEKIESFPLQLPGLLTTDMRTE